MELKCFPVPKNLLAGLHGDFDPKAMATASEQSILPLTIQSLSAPDEVLPFRKAQTRIDGMFFPAGSNDA